ncbi:MAG: PilZ domain-containing protein [Pirellulales bacterium]|nr:PilZ domain-containing protein [Pirellulales bacterium]
MIERRRYARMAFFCPVRLSALPNGGPVAANTFDISIGGVGLAAPVSLERGVDVRVRFIMKNDSGELVEEEVLGRVAYTQADEDGNRIGIEFLEVVSESSHPMLTRKLNSL